MSLVARASMGRETGKPFLSLLQIPLSFPCSERKQMIEEARNEKREESRMEKSERTKRFP